MCGRFTQQRPTSELARIFDAEDLALDDGGHFNVAPTDPASVVVARAEPDGGVRRAIVRYRWGLLPHWAADPRVASRTFNARAETITTSGMFREAFRHRRCLVPIDSFYEWQRAAGTRQPFRIHDPVDGVLALAGLWAGRRDPERDEVIRTFTIVTSAPNASMAPLHDRMPVVLTPDRWARWLDPHGGDPAELRALLEPRDEIALAAYPVVRLVNSVRNQGPDLIAPLDEATGPAERVAGPMAGLFD